MSKIAAIVPARLSSTRLPGKLLLNETGMPLIQHTIANILQSELIAETIVATEDEQIVAAVQHIPNVRCVLTPKCATGTDRVRWVVRAGLCDASHIINIQGDEPEIDPSHIDQLADILHRTNDVVTLAHVITAQVAASHSVVKVVVNHEQLAMYFSRAMIPFGGQSYLGHIGTYGYTAEFLQLDMPDSLVAETESLEQLQWLSNSIPIRVKTVVQAAIGIDTKSEYKDFVQRWHMHQKN